LTDEDMFHRESTDDERTTTVQSSGHNKDDEEIMTRKPIGIVNQRHFYSAAYRRASYCICNQRVSMTSMSVCPLAYVRKELSYRRGTARRATLVNSCCFTSDRSYKDFKQQQ